MLGFKKKFLARIWAKMSMMYKHCLCHSWRFYCIFNVTLTQPFAILYCSSWLQIHWIIYANFFLFLEMDVAQVFCFVIFLKVHALQIECHTYTDFSCFNIISYHIISLIWVKSFLVRIGLSVQYFNSLSATSNLLSVNLVPPISMQIMQETHCFLEKFTQLAWILHDRRS